MNIDYFNKGKEVLYVLSHSAGCQAFFVGGVVRAFINKEEFNGIDICTNASIEKLHEVFGDTIVQEDKDGNMTVFIDGFTFYIQRYKMPRHQIKQLKNPSIYTDLIQDLSCRDFTINTITMTPSGQIEDLVGGVEDLQKGIIRSVEKPKLSFKEDPIRIIRALRFVSEYGYKLKGNVKDGMKKRKRMLKKVAFSDLDYEMRLLNEGENAKKAFKLITRYSLNKYLGFFSKASTFMKEHYVKLEYEDFLLLACVLNEECDDCYLNNVSNVELFKKAYNLAVANPKCKFDTLSLYSNGLDVCLRVYRINRLLKRCKKVEAEIVKNYNALPIKKTCDLAFKGEDILQVCSGLREDLIQEIVDEVIFNILDGSLNNNRDEIQSYIINKVSDITTDVVASVINEDTQEKPIVDNTNEEVNEEIVNDTIEEDAFSEFSSLKDRLDQQEKSLEEKDKLIQDLLKGINSQKILQVDETVNNVVQDLRLKGLLKIDDYELESRLRDMLGDYLASGGKTNEN